MSLRAGDGLRELEEMNNQMGLSLGEKWREGETSKSTIIVFQVKYVV